MISEVEMARILMPRSASALKAVAATPAWLRMPTPMIETLTTSAAPSTAEKPTLSLTFVSAFLARS